MIKILQGDVVTQTVLDGLTMHYPPTGSTGIFLGLIQRRAAIVSCGLMTAG